MSPVSSQGNTLAPFPSGFGSAFYPKLNSALGPLGGASLWPQDAQSLLCLMGKDSLSLLLRERLKGYLGSCGPVCYFKMAFSYVYFTQILGQFCKNYLTENAVPLLLPFVPWDEAALRLADDWPYLLQEAHGRALQSHTQTEDTLAELFRHLFHVQRRRLWHTFWSGVVPKCLYALGGVVAVFMLVAMALRLFSTSIVFP